MFNHFKEPVLGVRNDALDFDTADTNVSLSGIAFSAGAVTVTSSGGGAFIAVPEVVAPRELTVKDGAVLRTPRITAGEVLSFETVDQTETMEIAAKTSTITVSRLVRGVTVVGDVRRVAVDKVADTATLTTDCATVSGSASEVTIATDGSAVSVAVSRIGGVLSAVSDVSVAVETGNVSSAVAVASVTNVAGPFEGFRADAPSDDTRTVSLTSLDGRADVGDDVALSVDTVNTTVTAGPFVLGG